MGLRSFLVMGRQTIDIHYGGRSEIRLNFNLFYDKFLTNVESMSRHRKVFRFWVYPFTGFVSFPFVRLWLWFIIMAPLYIRRLSVSEFRSNFFLQKRYYLIKGVTKPSRSILFLYLGSAWSKRSRHLIIETFQELTISRCDLNSIIRFDLQYLSI